MSKIMFVGDPHLDNRTPISRLDDYSIVSIDKLLIILKKALESNVGHVVMLGDMFDRYETSFIYLNTVLETFKRFKDEGIKVYSLIGNHDLPHNNKRYFNQTPLALLFKSGLVSHLVKEDIGNTTVYGMDFTEKDTLPDIIKSVEASDKPAILAMHYAVDNTIPNEALNRADLTKFDLVVSGHDHMYYPYSELDKPIVLRPGSLIRRTKDAYNITREPLVYVYDTSTKKIDEIKLGAKPAAEVFKAEIMIGGVSSLDLSSFSNLFNEAYFKKESISIEDLINDLPIDITPETKTYLINYFKNV